MWRTLGAESMTSGIQRRRRRCENLHAMVVVDMSKQKNSLEAFKLGIAMTESVEVIGKRFVHVKHFENQPCDDASETNELWIDRTAMASRPSDHWLLGMELFVPLSPALPE
jgi:hypothetical protein